MNEIIKEETFNRIPKMVLAHDKNLFTKIMMTIMKSKADEVKKYEILVNGHNWIVYEAPTFKMFLNDSTKDYHEFYSKLDGFTLRFGKTIEDDPKWCELGNTIADIEVVSGKCPKINGHNCRFCYKSNGGNIAHCMTISQAEKLIDFVNQNHQLTQIAWGITGFYTNQDFEHILELCKSKGISANYTTNGVDLDDHAIDVTLDNCGRVAVSCYEGAKEICYDTIKKFGIAAEKKGMKFPCNIHVVLSQGTFNHVKEVLRDAAEGKIENLGAIVMLRMKNVGRAKNLNPFIPDLIYEYVVNFCLEHHIKFGFDSCGCHRVGDVLKKIGREDLISSIEPCESSRFSGYWNVDSKFYNCSFCEQLEDHTAIDPFKYNTFTEFWNSEEVGKLRNPANGWACRSCPFMNLD